MLIGSGSKGLWNNSMVWFLYKLPWVLAWKLSCLSCPLKINGWFRCIAYWKHLFFAQILKWWRLSKTTMLIVLKWEVLCNQSTALPSSSHCRENTQKNNENMVAKHEHPKLLSKKLFFHPKDFFSGSTFYNSLRSSKFARIELKDLYKSRAFKALLMGDDYHGWSPPKRTPYRKQGFNSRPYWGKPMVKIRP